MNHIMIDLETTGKTPGCKILSLGAVMDNGATFYESFSSSSQFRLEDDPSTIAWWEKQDPDVKHLAFSGTMSLTQGLQKFHDWVERHRIAKVGLKIWGNGADFDKPILEHAMKVYGVRIPWSFTGGRCYRTMKNIFPLGDQEIKNPQAHNALEDAKTQMANLQLMAIKYKFNLA